MPKDIYSLILNKKKEGRKLFAILIDPDKFELKSGVLKLAETCHVDFILVGGSLMTKGVFESCVQTIKKNTTIPVLIFPGNNLQISSFADGILLLSLISGRNADLLIGNHVIAAPVIRNSKLEVLPTGYILIDGGKQTAVSYVSNTLPIPSDQDSIAMSTAMAGEMLGLKLLYLDAGSGAKKGVSQSMIKLVKSSVNIPVIVGGGINTPAKAVAACLAGADVIVVGNAIEKSKILIKNLSLAIHNL